MQHPLFSTLLPPEWQVLSVDRIKSLEPHACVAGPFGSNISSKYFVEEGVPIIRGANLRDDLTQFVPEGFAFVSPDRARSYAAQHVRGGDLVFTCWGTIGQVGLIPDRGPYPEYIISNKQLKLRPNLAIADSRYLFYYFASPQMVQHIRAHAIGAAVPGINLGILKALPVVLPPLADQQRIAGILSAYDDLIANCERRIRVLDEMARALYREWFVLFRYPGHHKTSMARTSIGEIPRGWDAGSLNEGFGTVQDGDWVETKDQGGNDYRLLQISNIGLGEFLETGNHRYVTAQTFARLRCAEIVPGDILVARMPTPIGRAWLVTPREERMITAVDVAIIRADVRKLVPSFFVRAWNDEANLRRIAAQASGTTRLRVTRRELAALPFVIPPISLQRLFDQRVQAGAALVVSLREQTANLRRARDLLLPRLLSGQLTVT